MLRLALLDDLAFEHLKFSTAELFSYADEIMAELKKEDRPFHDHIVEAQKQKPRPNIKVSG
jgi:hypothetical protein